MRYVEIDEFLHFPHPHMPYLYLVLSQETMWIKIHVAELFIHNFY